MSDNSSVRQPLWKELPEEAFAVWGPELPKLADEIIAAIRAEVPAYARPLEGTFGRSVHGGVQEALRRFGDRHQPDDPEGASGNVYRALGQGEARDGRSLEALLAAYRIGARVAWRRLAAAGVAAELDPGTLVFAAEALFAYIDELSAESAEGFAQEQAAQAGETERRRTELMEVLLRSPPASAKSVDTAAVAAGWAVPAQVAVLVWPVRRGRRPLARLPLGALAVTIEDLWCAAIPDPAAPGRRAELERAGAGGPAGLGPAVPPVEAARSLRRAREALALAQDRAVAGLLASDEHLRTLLLRADESLIGELAHARLAPLDDETPRSRERLQETLLAWLRHEGNATAAGDELGVHGQTVRYRLARLRELFGDDLDDPDVRYELETVLRAGADAAG